MTRVRAERVELPRDELELRWESSCRTNVEHRVAVVLVGGDAAEHRERQQEERKQRQQRVVGDRRRVGQVVAVVEADEARATADSAVSRATSRDAAGAASLITRAIAIAASTRRADARALARAALPASRISCFFILL